MSGFGTDDPNWREKLRAYCESRPMGVVGLTFGAALELLNENAQLRARVAELEEFIPKLTAIIDQDCIDMSGHNACGCCEGRWIPSEHLVKYGPRGPWQDD